MRTRQRITLALVLALYAAPAAGLSEVICTGDCNYDHTAAINELVTGVAIALDQASIDTCRGFDLNGNDTASVDELIGGVRSALHGCPRARLLRTACDFNGPAGPESARPDCGFAIVQEDRSRNDGRTIRIPYVACRAPNPDGDYDPIVILGGGPGGPDGQVASPRCDDPANNRFQARFDIVWLDQRGTGRSLPSLDCPEWRAAFSSYLTVAQSVDEDVAAQQTALRACHDRLASAGVNFGAYTSSASAHDVRDLLLALGYDTWKLYGISYGTRVAMTALRDTPERIRSVVLDAALPLPANWDADFAVNFQRALDTLFAGCANDPACNAAFPDLEQTFFDFVAELNLHPLTLHPPNPAGGAPLTVVVTGDRLLLGIQQAMYDTALLPLVPLVITSAAQGNTALLTAAAAQVAVPSRIAFGLYHSVLCNEEVPFITPEILAAANAGVRDEIKNALTPFFTQHDLEVCTFWGSSPPAAIENEPVVSDVPALILTGEYDPVTPPAYGRLAAETLSHSTFFELPGIGHGTLNGTACAVDLAFAFQSDPSRPPDASCIDEIPPLRFALP